MKATPPSMANASSCGVCEAPITFPDMPRPWVQPSPSRARLDKFPHNNRMDCSDDAANSDDGAGSDNGAGSDLEWDMFRFQLET